MTTKDELKKNEAAEKSSKIVRVKKFTKQLGKSSIIMPRVVRIYMQDNDATDSSKKKDAKLLPENVKKYKGVRQRELGRWASEIQYGRKNARRWLGAFDTVREAALAYDKAVIEIRGANALTNILEPPTKESTPSISCHQ
ncbi:hypothetical protein H5410_000785 [Solanum commersonii]|uniref:AP2/ERF domain-containing protein n=1 Tax=Solanum commersonii TaxID=4109 RepID=A0A9J6AX79_SOLCO|nr:hypothetical protein H5410_000785 [Solanum commersonii]